MTMQITPVLQRIALEAGNYRNEPLDALFVTAAPYDLPWPPDPNYDLIDVQPAVVATTGKATGEFGFGPVGLRVGIFTIAELDVNQNASPAHTVSASLTSFVHQLAGGSYREPGEFPDLFSGAIVRWGDGSHTNITNVATSGATHTYSAAGTYDITYELNFAESANFAWSNHPSATVRRVVS